MRSLDGHAAVAHDPADVLALDVNLERVRGTLGRRLGQRAHVRGVQEGRDLGLGVTNRSRRAANHEERFVALAADAHARLLFDALDDLAAFADDEPAVLERARRVFLDKLGGVAGWAGWMPRRERSSSIVESAAAGGRAAILVTVVTPAAIVPAVPVVEAAASAVAASVAGGGRPSVLAADDAVFVVADDSAKFVGGEVDGSPGPADHHRPVPALPGARLGFVDHDVRAGSVLELLDGAAVRADDDLGDLRRDLHLVFVLVGAGLSVSPALAVA